MNYAPKRAKYGVIEPIDAYFLPPKSFWLLGNPSPFMDQIYDEKQVLDLDGIPAPPTPFMDQSHSSIWTTNWP